MFIRGAGIFSVSFGGKDGTIDVKFHDYSGLFGAPETTQCQELLQVYLQNPRNRAKMNIPDGIDCTIDSDSMGENTVKERVSAQARWLSPHVRKERKRMYSGLEETSWK